MLVFKSAAVAIERSCLFISCLCVHTWSVHFQIHLPCCVYAGGSLESHCLEVNDDINECSHDDKPSTGMFARSDEQLLFLCTAFALVLQPFLLRSTLHCETANARILC